MGEPASNVVPLRSEASIRDLIERQGWGWTLSHPPGCDHYYAYVNTGSRISSAGDGRTPEQAMADAYTKAMREQLAALVSPSPISQGA